PLPCTESAQRLAASPEKSPACVSSFFSLFAVLNASRHHRKNRYISNVHSSSFLGAQRLAASPEKSLRASNPLGIHVFAVQIAGITSFLWIFGGAGRN